MNNTTLVLGASTNSNRYSYKAVVALTEKNFPVIAFGRKAGKINNVEIKTNLEEIPEVHTVTLYLNPTNQEEYLDFIIDQCQPKRIIFNPGTENPKLIELCRDNNIEAVTGCTLIMLSVGNYMG